MPIHFEDVDVAPEVEGLRSALIVPCNLCPAVTVATRENRPFLRFFRSPVKSPPFEAHLERLRSRLGEKGVRTKVFRSHLYHQWFMCMWTARRRKKLEREAKSHDAVIVLGCDSARETVCDAVPAGVKVIEGMKTTGIMNGRLSFRLPGDLFFDPSSTPPNRNPLIARHLLARTSALAPGSVCRGVVGSQLTFRSVGGRATPAA